MSTDDTRTRILNVAGPIFAEKGFRQATVREICQAAGVNLASVNYYFGDKEKLYVQSVRRAHQLLAEQVPSRDLPEGTSPATKLKSFISTMITRMIGLQGATWQRRLMLREILQPSAACTALVDDYFRPHFDRLLGILDEMLPPETPPHKRHQIGFSIVGQCFYYRVAGEVVSMMVSDAELAEHYQVEQLAEHISQVCLAALGWTAPLAGSDGLRGEPEARDRAPT